MPLVAIKRATKLYRERSAAGFFAPKPRREGTKLTAEKLEQARALLVQGEPLAVVSQATGVLVDTLRKAIGAGRLPALKKGIGKNAPLSDTASAAGESAPAPGGPGDGGPVGVASELPAVVSGK